VRAGVVANAITALSITGRVTLVEEGNYNY